MDENSYRLIGVVIFLAGAGISGYFRRRADRRAGMEKISLKAEGLPIMLALRITGAALWLGVFAYLINPDWMTWSQIQLPAWLRLTGAALGVLADGLLVWVFASLGDNVTPTVVTRAQHTLVTTGPYRWVRHPLYSVGFLSLMSFALLAGSWYIAALSVASIVAISLRVPLEESALIARNGEVYRAYAERTGRFLPKLG